VRLHDRKVVTREPTGLRWQSCRDNPGGASPFDTTKRIVQPDGEVRYIRCLAAPVVENQKLKKCVGTAVDVTDHEFLTQELRCRETHRAQPEALSHTGSSVGTHHQGSSFGRMKHSLCLAMTREHTARSGQESLAQGLYVFSAGSLARRSPRRGLQFGHLERVPQPRTVPHMR
jgi:hypothetical protein